MIEMMIAVFSSIKDLFSSLAVADTGPHQCLEQSGGYEILGHTAVDSQIVTDVMNFCKCRLDWK